MPDGRGPEVTMARPRRGPVPTAGPGKGPFGSTKVASRADNMVSPFWEVADSVVVCVLCLACVVYVTLPSLPLRFTILAGVSTCEDPEHGAVGQGEPRAEPQGQSFGLPWIPRGGKAAKRAVSVQEGCWDALSRRPAPPRIGAGNEGCPCIFRQCLRLTAEPPHRHLASQYAPMPEGRRVGHLGTGGRPGGLADVLPAECLDDGPKLHATGSP